MCSELPLLHFLFLPWRPSILDINTFFHFSNLFVQATAKCTWILFLRHLPYVFSGNMSFICLVSFWNPLLRLLAVCNIVYLVVCVMLVRYNNLY